MSDRKDEYWPFPVSNGERQNPDVADKIAFLESVTTAGFRGLRSGDMYYGAESTVRSGGIIQRGRKGRWELRLVDNEKLNFQAFVSSFQVAAEGLLAWLQGKSVYDVISDIEDSLVIMGESPTGYTINHQGEDNTTLS